MNTGCKAGMELLACFVEEERNQKKHTRREHAHSYMSCDAETLHTVPPCHTPYTKVNK